MRGVGVDIAAAVGAEHFNGDLRGDGALHNDLFVHFLIHHHGDVGDDRLALGIQLGDIHHHGDAVGQDGLSFVIPLGCLHHDRQVCGHALAFGIGLLDLDGVRFEEPGLGVGMEILDDALRHQDHGEHDADGQQQIIGRADHIHPEIAEGRHGMAGEAAHERGGEGDAGGGGAEVVDDERDHLREIGHGGFAGVTLPVGVGGEADGGVERQVGRERGKVLGVQQRLEGQLVLQPQNRIGEHAAHRAEQQHGDGVLQPVLLAVRRHAHEAAGDFFQRLEEGIKPRPAFRIENLDEIEAHGFGDEGEGGHEQAELEPVKRAHRSEFFGPQHGHHEVEEQQHGDAANNEVFHNQSLPQARAYKPLARKKARTVPR